MTGLHHAGSYVLLDVPEAQAAADVDPRIMLEGEMPRLLDEWQTVPQVWNLARRAVDFSNQPVRFILTGSAVPTADSVRHTGASRFIRIRQRIMTWAEKADELAIPGIGLQDLFSGSQLTPSMRTSPLADVVNNVLTPGFPALRAADAQVRTRALNGYLQDIATTYLFTPRRWAAACIATGVPGRHHQNRRDPCDGRPHFLADRAKAGLRCLARKRRGP